LHAGGCAHIGPRSFKKVIGRTLLAAALVQGVTAAAPASELQEGEAGVHHRHEVAFFMGAAIRDDEETESGFALGLEYQYRLHRLLGVGALAEGELGDLRDLLLVAPISFHPWRGLRLVVAPGAEIPNEGSTEFALRLGAGYKIPLGGRFTLVPEFNADLIEGHPTYVFGANLAVGF
jgi:hypothetical protein